MCFIQMYQVKWGGEILARLKGRSCIKFRNQLKVTLILHHLSTLSYYAAELGANNCLL
jgi:hypothetical protein